MKMFFFLKVNKLIRFPGSTKEKENVILRWKIKLNFFSIGFVCVTESYKTS